MLFCFNSHIVIEIKGNLKVFILYKMTNINNFSLLEAHNFDIQKFQNNKETFLWYI